MHDERHRGHVDADRLKASRDADGPQRAGSAGGEVAPIEKVDEAIEANFGEDEGLDHEIDREDVRALDSGQPKGNDEAEFVATWIRMSFPDVSSEDELASQVAALEQHCAATEGAGPVFDERTLCAECSAFTAAFACEECGLTLCFRCTDVIHIIPSLSVHRIRLDVSSRSNQALASQQATRSERDASELPSNPLAVSASMTTQEPESRLALPAGTPIFFRVSDCSRWPRELLHGTMVSREPATTSTGGSFYHRVLWLRGVEALPNGFFRAGLTLPGWDVSSDNEDDIGETFWPHEIGVFPTQLGALRAVVTAEQIARGKFRRDLQGGRIHRWRSPGSDSEQLTTNREEEPEEFPSSPILDEVVAETAAVLGKEFGVRLTRQSDAQFHHQLAQGTWSFRKWMETIGRADHLHEEDAVPFEFGVASRDPMQEDEFNEELETRVPTPWAPATRSRFFMVAQRDLVFPEIVRRQHLRAILEQLLFVYAGYAWRLWAQYVELHRDRQEQQSREQAACALQAWARRMAERKRQRERQLLLSMAIGSSIDALELYRRRQIEAKKLYTFMTRQIEERRRNALSRWRLAVGPSAPPPPPATTWHPSHGMKAMLPKLPRMGARRRTVQDKAALGSQVIIEDMATYKLFRANHAGPADTSYWVIRGRVLAGACPIGPAFRDARRLVSRTDFATSVLLQQVSVFICLMEPHELRSVELATGGGAADTETGWSYERQVRAKYQALCRELKSANTISKRHVELAQQALVDFDVGAANAAAAAIGGSGTKNSKKRRSSMSMQQQQDEDAAEEAKMKEAREAVEHKLQLAQQQAAKAAREVARLGVMEIEFLYFPIAHDGVSDSDELLGFLEDHVEARLRAGKNLYVFSRLGHGRTGLVSALLLGRVYGITASEALERAQRAHDCQRPDAPRGLSYCSPTTAPQLAFVRRALARSMDPIYAPLVLENSAEKFRSTRVQQRGLLAEPFLKDEGFMVSAAGDEQARDREAREHKRLERIARRESAAAALQRERRRQQREHEVMEAEESEQAAQEAMARIYDEVVSSGS